jgi:hypothetical protein
MVKFRRDTVRHRTRYYADVIGTRYEVELLGNRWLAWARDASGLWAIGDTRGFGTLEEAEAAAKADANAPLNTGRTSAIGDRRRFRSVAP